MSIDCYGTKYFAISNLFIKSADGDFFTFPAPYALSLQSDSQDRSTLEICYANYYESPLVLDYIYSLFFYIFLYDGTVETLYFQSVWLKEEPRNESYGYKAVCGLDALSLLRNISEKQFYGDLNKLKQTILPNPRSIAR